MEPDLRVRVTERGLALRGGREVPLLSGAMHYWRLPETSWRACLVAMRDMGFGIVETYVPWRVHEDASGAIDMTSCVRFLELVHELGLLAIVRPGPHINAELTGFGFPDCVLENDDMLARTARGTPVWVPAPPRMFPAPSYASRTFREAASAWLRASSAAMAPLRWPEGPIVAVQVDNEFQMFFRLGAYDHDYHPDAIAWWRELVDRDPPRRWDPDDAETCLRWVAFKDDYAARALAWVDDAIADGGLVGVPGLHNLPPTAPELACLPRLEEVLSQRQEAVVGVDFYQRNREYRRYRRRALYLLGSARTLPYAPEVGLGGALWIEPMPAEEQANVMRGLLMGGVRAMNLYMAVERDRWYGAPISEAGERVGELAPFVERMLAWWNEVGWERLSRRARVAVVMSRESMQLAVASGVADPLTPVLLQLGLGRGGPAMLSRASGPADVQAWMDGVSNLLDDMHVPYVWVDEAVGKARFDRYELVLRPGEITVDQVAERARRFVPTRWVPEGTAPVDTEVFVDEAGEARVLFAANRGDAPISARLGWDRPIVDAFSGVSVTPRASVIDLALAPGEVRVLVVR